MNHYLLIEMTPFPQMGVYDQVAGGCVKIELKFRYSDIYGFRILYCDHFRIQ